MITNSVLCYNTCELLLDIYRKLHLFCKCVWILRPIWMCRPNTLLRFTRSCASAFFNCLCKLFHGQNVRVFFQFLEQVDNTTMFYRYLKLSKSLSLKYIMKPLINIDNLYYWLDVIRTLPLPFIIDRTNEGRLGAVLHSNTINHYWL